MNTYRITYLTQCGKTNIVVETGNCYAEAYRKAKAHIEMKHSPMKIVKAELKVPSSRCKYGCSWTSV